MKLKLELSLAKTYITPGKHSYAQKTLDTFKEGPPNSKMVKLHKLYQHGGGIQGKSQIINKFHLGKVYDYGDRIKCLQSFKDHKSFSKRYSKVLKTPILTKIWTRSQVLRLLIEGTGYISLLSLVGSDFHSRYLHPYDQ